MVTDVAVGEGVEITGGIVPALQLVFKTVRIYNND